MTSRRDDDEADLRDAFQALRQEDAQDVPRFEAALAGAHGDRHRPDLAVPAYALLLVAAVLGALVVVGRQVQRAPATPATTASIERWVAPTDFLLRTPGSEVLTSVPRIGGASSLALLEGLPPASSPASKPRSMSP